MATMIIGYQNEYLDMQHIPEANYYIRNECMRKEHFPFYSMGN